MASGLLTNAGNSGMGLEEFVIASCEELMLISFDDNFELFMLLFSLDIFGFVMFKWIGPLPCLLT